MKIDSVDQIKNVSQEKEVKIENHLDVKVDKKRSIDSFSELLEICTQNKEVKLRYELEKNVNLVSFEKNRVEISFNENLDKNFLKDLSLKLFEWTGQRWIITFSKEIGKLSKKDKEYLDKSKIIDEAKKDQIYREVLKSFPDAELIDVKLDEDEL